MKAFYSIVYVITFTFAGLFSEEYSAEVRSTVPNSGQIINYGPVFLNDTLEILFTAKNTGEKPIKIEQGIPTFFLGLSPNDITTVQWERFRRVSPPRTYQPGDEDTIRINFLSGDTLVTRTGWHEALLGLGFLPADKDDNKTISKIDTFFLRVKKTPYYVSGFEDDIRFDSVYVNPNITPQKIWRVKNVWTKNQPAFGFDRQLITQPFSRTEISVPDLPITPLEIYPDSIISIPVTYYPLNRGRDSMFLKLLYKPLLFQFPDSVDFAWTRIAGVGVEQDIRISNSNYNWKGDTIDIGSIKAGSRIGIELAIKNFGNIPFGLISQEFYNPSGSIINDLLIFDKKFLHDGIHLKPDSLATAKLLFSPEETGLFLAELRLESDILNRSITGVQPDRRYVPIYLRAQIVSPKIVMHVSDINLGNVISSSPECSSERDTSVYIFNSGNMDLIISNILTDPPYPDSRFFVDKDFLQIPPGSGDSIRIQFRVQGGDFDTYSSKILLVTNQANPFDTVKVSITANSVPPVAANLSIPQNLKSKPGTLIEVPVILSANGNNPANFAKSFRTSLFYNRSILEFAGLRTIGTACEGSLNYGDNIEIAESDELMLDIRSPAQTFFFAKDTLVFLKFRTYLGNSAATEIAFIEPKFGDNKCENLFTIINTGGTYYTDSVCGIDYKALPSVNGNFRLDVMNSSNKVIEIELPYSTNAELRIIDIYGQSVEFLMKSDLPSGIYNFTANFHTVSSGLYFVELSTPAIKLVKPFPVVH
ncbi:MAG: hypothetical protein KIT33_04240 [Candidatus Kapabacteria bacterium]|nr:hypothetical protein [Ignavibacteriota bacterium]MCW5884165.1 hypothetical protein [Candidatus Kapabacteria bacterium]